MAQFSVNAQRFDPYKNFKFRVKWDGRYVAGISKVGALKRSTELVEHREHGWLVPAGDVDALVHAMLEVLRTPASRLSEMGRAGRERVLLRHDVDTEARKLVSLFQGAA